MRANLKVVSSCLMAILPTINPVYADTTDTSSRNNDAKSSQTTSDDKVLAKDAQVIPKKVPTSPPVLEGKIEKGYRTIEWHHLMPAEDYEALMNPPSYLSEIEDGSPEDQISGQIQSAIASASDSQYQKALSSSTIREEYDQQKIRLPGFVVPLEFDDNSVITSFFLVPYFGACIHQPPPPPNQIIYAEYKKGFTVEALYYPFWMEGTLSTTLVENDMATAAYSVSVDNIYLYKE